MQERDSSRRARYVVRLPLPVAARLAAWCELHPQRSRSDLVADLLDAALAAAEHSLKPPPAPPAAPTASGVATRQAVYLPSGPFAEFHGLVQKHHLELERELDHEAAEVPYPAVDYLLSEE
jgi:hypothetical protein